MDAGAAGEAVGEAAEAQVDEGEGDSKGDMGVVRLREPSFRSDPLTTGAVGARFPLLGTGAGPRGRENRSCQMPVFDSRRP